MKNIQSDLEWLLDNFVDPVLFPYEKDGIIYIGEYMIYHSDDIYIVKNIKGIFVSGKTYTKHGAFALAKSLNKRRSNREKILKYDNQIYHGMNDILFFKNVLNNSKDDVYRKNISIRYYDICQLVDSAKFSLKSMI